MSVKYYASIDINGNPLYAMTFSLSAPVDTGEVFFKPVIDDIAKEELLSKYWWNNGWLFRGERPPYGIWTQVDNVWQWVVDIESCRALKLEYINQAYSAANLATFEYAGLEFNADIVAQNNLNATAHYIGMFNEFPPNWLGAWLDKDGTPIAMLSLSAFKDLYKAFVAKGVANITRFELLKTQILSASSVAELEAINW